MSNFDYRREDYSMLARCERDYKPDICWRSYKANWEAFKIPHTLLDVPQAVQSSVALALPTELLLKIFSHSAPFAQLCFALSCKRLLAISSMITIKIPSAAIHRTINDCACDNRRGPLLRLLQLVHPLDNRGQPDKRSWAVCEYCYRYRPRNRGYWEVRSELYRAEAQCKGAPMMSSLYFDDIIEEWWLEANSDGERICPQCWLMPGALLH